MENFFFSQRLIFKTLEAAPDVASQAAAEVKKPSEGYTVDKLNTETEQVAAKVRNLPPAVQAELRDEAVLFQQMIDACKTKLAALGEDKNAERNALGQKVRTAVDTFLALKLDNLAINGKKFIIDPPLSMIDSVQIEQKAKVSLGTMKEYSKTLAGKKGTIDENSASYINGYIECRANFKNASDKPGDKYATVTIAESQVIEEIHNEETENAEKETGNFFEALNNWKAANPAPESFQYKDASGREITVKTAEIFSDQGLDFSKNPADCKKLQENLNVDLLLAYNSNESLRNLSRQKWEINTYTYEKKADGSSYIARTEKIKTSILQTEKAPVKETYELDEKGNPRKKIEERTEIVAQQSRNIKIVTEFWQNETNEPLKIKKQEKYSDGIVESVSEYGKDGNLINAKTTVAGCEEIQAIDNPTGKMIEAQDDLGRRIFMNKEGHKFFEEKFADGRTGFVDEQGRFFLGEADATDTGKIRYIGQGKASGIVLENVGEVEKVPEVNRVMHFTSEGKQIEIKSYDAMANEQGSNFTKEAYLKYLGSVLKTPEQRHAFSHLAMAYKYDYKFGKIIQDYQSWDKTVGLTRQGRMEGDCEDQAVLNKEIWQAEGKKNVYAVQLPGHTACIRIERNANGKYSVESWDTWGYDKNGNVVGREKNSEKDQGYDTLEQALESVAAKWNVINSGNLEMKNGSILHKDTRDKTKSGLIVIDNVHDIDSMTETGYAGKFVPLSKIEQDLAEK